MTKHTSSPAPLPNNPDALLTRAQLREHFNISYSHTHLRRMAKDGQFPQPLQLGLRRVAWRVADIQAWINSRKGARAYAATAPAAGG
jgi:predicted DNA-binding transcriptional regulator AlpA